ncbi:A24 family peptidase [Brevibacterium sp. UMB10442]|nr:A24 family peptidase [Brevibacterium sp. UMB10442]
MSEHHDDLGSGEPAQNPAEVEPADRGYRLLETWDPPRWVLVALFGAGGVLAVATLVAYGWNHPSAYVAAVFVAVSPILAAIDFAERRLPDVVTLPAAGASVIALVAGGLTSGDWGSALRGGAGLLILFVAFFVMFIFAGGAFGFGDVKLGLSMGAVLGTYSWFALLLGPFIGMLLGFAVGVVLMIMRKATMKTAIALGPYLIIGTLVIIVIGALG